MAQAPQGLNYQAVLRNAQGQLISNQPVLLTFEILQGSPAGSVSYSEEQSLTTNDLGLVTAVIGEGNSTGQLSDVAWSSGEHFLKVTLDQGSGAVDLGTTQLLSVPYALFADSVANVNDADADATNELQTLALSGNDLSLSDGNSVTLDADTTNEWQNLNLNGTLLEISNGNSADLASLVDDADADSSNELQNLSFSGTTLSLTDGGSVNLGSLVDDADADPSNELQNISFSGTTLSLTNGGSANLGSLVDDADADPTNELQSLSFNGNVLSLSNGNSVNLGGLINDADPNPTNELQNLSLSGNNLSLSNGNNVDLNDLKGLLIDHAFASGTGSAPSATTRFLVAPATIDVTSGSQTVVITSHGLLGNSNLINASADLDLSIGYRFAGTTGLNLVPPGLVDVRLGPNQRQVFGLTVVLTNLVPGTYEFGLAGDDDGNGNWNSNGAGYTTVLLYN